MCTEIYIDGHFCQNIGELRAVVGDKFATSYAGPYQDNECLCSLDLEATAELNHMTVRPGKNEWAGTPIISRRGAARL